jgi:uncharacterized membrane protein YcaP (DUF421 family)
MEMILRAVAIYLILLVVFKVVGRRALLQMTSFDLILLLIISEATQQALLGNDFSVTGAMLTIITLVASPICTNSGTLTTAPVDRVAGLPPVPAVSPFRPGSVSMISSSTKFGGVTAIG